MGKVTYLKPGQKVCPVCGSTHIVDICRITGYLSPTERWNESKKKELDRRINHNV